MKRLCKGRLIEEPRKLNELVQNLLTHVLACVWRYHNKEQWLYKYAVILHVKTYSCIQVCTYILNTETHKQIGFNTKLFSKRLSQTLINLPSCQYNTVWYSWNWRPFASSACKAPAHHRWKAGDLWRSSQWKNTTAPNWGYECYILSLTSLRHNFVILAKTCNISACYVSCRKGNFITVLTRIKRSGTESRTTTMPEHQH